VVEGSQVSGDVFANSLDFGELGGAAGGGLSISQGSEFLLEFVNVDTNGLGVQFSDLLINFLFHHPNINNIKNELIFNLFIYPHSWAECKQSLIQF
jgi:hypothetical protein